MRNSGWVLCGFLLYLFRSIRSRLVVALCLPRELVTFRIIEYTSAFQSVLWTVPRLFFVKVFPFHSTTDHLRQKQLRTLNP